MARHEEVGMEVFHTDVWRQSVYTECPQYPPYGLPTHTHLSAWVAARVGRRNANQKVVVRGTERRVVYPGPSCLTRSEGEQINKPNVLPETS